MVILLEEKHLQFFVPKKLDPTCSYLEFVAFSDTDP